MTDPTTPAVYVPTAADIAAEEKRRQHDQAVDVVEQSQGLNSDGVKAADALGEAHPVDPKIAGQLLADIRRKGDVDRMRSSGYFSRRPGLAAWMFDGGNAAYVENESQLLSHTYDALARETAAAKDTETKESLNAAQWLAHGTRQGAKMVHLGVLAGPAAIAKAMGDEGDAYNWYGTYDRMTAEDEAAATFRQGFAQKAYVAAGRMALSLPLSIGAVALATAGSVGATLTANAMIGAADEFVSTIPTAAQANIAAGQSAYLSPAQITLAAASGAVTMATERLFGPVGEMAWLNKSGWMSFSKSVALGATQEFVEEGAQTALGGAASGPVYWDDIWESATIGAMLGGGAPVVMTAGQAIPFSIGQQSRELKGIVKRGAQAAAVVKTMDSVIRATAGMSQTQLAQDSVSRAEAFAKSALPDADKNITWTIEAWREAVAKAGKGLTPEQALAQFRAVESNGMVTMPIYRAVVAFSKTDKALLGELFQNASVSEDGMILADAAEILSKMPERLEEWKKMAEKPTLARGQIEDDGHLVEADIEAELEKFPGKKGTKGVTANERKMAAKSTANVMRAIAEQLTLGGVPTKPSEVWTKYKPQFTMEGHGAPVAPTPTLEQPTRGGYTPQTRTLNLNQIKDLSSLSHELSHYYLHTYTQLASAPNAPAFFKERLAELDSWAAAHADEVVAGYPKEVVDPDDIRTHTMTDTESHAWAAKHEYFARGYEAYIKEGVAPTSGLRKLYNAFSGFIAKIYATISLDVTLDTASRMMFKRILASQTQIDETAQELAFTEEVIDYMKGTGLTNEEVELLLTANSKLRNEAENAAIDKITKERVKEHKKKVYDELDKITEEEVRGNPTPMVQGMITLVTMKGDHPQMFGDSHLFGKTMNRADAKEKLLPAEFQRLEDEKLLSDDGLSIDDISTIVGSPTTMAEISLALTDKRNVSTSFNAHFNDTRNNRIVASPELEQLEAITEEAIRQTVIEELYGPHAQEVARLSSKLLRNRLRSVRAIMHMTDVEVKEREQELKDKIKAAKEKGKEKLAEVTSEAKFRLEFAKELAKEKQAATEAKARLGKWMATELGKEKLADMKDSAKSLASRTGADTRHANRMRLQGLREKDSSWQKIIKAAKGEQAENAKGYLIWYKTVLEEQGHGINVLAEEKAEGRTAAALTNQSNDLALKIAAAAANGNWKQVTKLSVDQMVLDRAAEIALEGDQQEAKFREAYIKEQFKERLAEQKAQGKDDLSAQKQETADAKKTGVVALRWNDAKWNAVVDKLQSDQKEHAKGFGAWFRAISKEQAYGINTLAEEMLGDLSKDWTEKGLQSRAETLTLKITDAAAKGKWDHVAALATDLMVTDQAAVILSDMNRKDAIAKTRATEKAKGDKRVAATKEQWARKLLDLRKDRDWSEAALDKELQDTKAELNAAIEGQVFMSEYHAAKAKHETEGKLKPIIEKLKHAVLNAKMTSRWDQAAAVKKAEGKLEQFKSDQQMAKDYADAKQEIRDMDPEVIIAGVRGLVQATRISDFNPDAWRAMSKQSAKELSKAFQKKDLIKAAEAQQWQIACMERACLEEEAYANYRKTKKLVAVYADPASKESRELTASDPAFADALHAIMAHYGYGTDPHVDAATGQKIAQDLLPYGTKLLLLSTTTPVSERTAQDWDDLQTAMGNLVGASETDNKAFALNAGKSIDTQAAELEKTIYAGAKKPASQTKLAGFLRTLGLIEAKPLMMLSALGGAVGGIPEQVAHKLQDVTNNYATESNIIGKAWAELNKVLGWTQFDRVRMSMASPIEGTEHSMSVFDRAGIAALWGSEDGRDRAIGSIQITYPQRSVINMATVDGKNYEVGTPSFDKLSPEKKATATFSDQHRPYMGYHQAEALAMKIINSLESVHGAKELVEFYWAQSDSLFSRIIEMLKTLRITPPPTTTNAPFFIGKTKMGGGYFTIKYKNVDFTPLVAFEGLDGGAMVDGHLGSGFLNERVEHYKGQLELGPAVFMAQMAAKARYLHMRPLAGDLHKLLHRNNVVSAITTMHGSEFNKTLWNNIAHVFTGPTPPKNFWEQMVQHSTTTASMSTLGVNTGSALQQIFGLSNAANEVKARYIAEATKLLSGTPVVSFNKFKALRGQYQFLANRTGLTDPSLHTAFESISSTIIDPRVKSAMMVPIAMMQGMVDTITFQAGLIQAQAEHPTKGKAYAAKFAESAVRKSQGGSEDIDRTALHHSGAYARALASFMTPFTVAYNQMYGAVKTKNTPAILRAMTFAVAVPIVTSMFWELLKGGGPEDDESAAQWAKWIAMSGLSSSMMMHPVTRLAERPLIDGRPVSISGTRGWEAMGKGFAAAGDGKWGTAGRSWFKGTAMLTGVPSSAPLNWYDGVNQMIDGDVAKGLTTTVIGHTNPSK